MESRQQLANSCSGVLFICLEAVLLAVDHWPQSGLLVQLALKIRFFSNLSVAAALSNTIIIYIGRNPKYSIPRPPQRYIKNIFILIHTITFHYCISV